MSEKTYPENRRFYTREGAEAFLKFFPIGYMIYDGNGDSKGRWYWYVGKMT